MPCAEAEEAWRDSGRARLPRPGTTGSAFNGVPPDDEAAGLARQYGAQAPRPGSAGDMVVVGEAALIAARARFVSLPGSFTPVHVHEHGTHPIS